MDRALIFAMPDSDKLRDSATRLFAMVLKARDHGFSCADDLADLANKALAQADEIDRALMQAQRPVP
jgi:hypothetical protein